MRKFLYIMLLCLPMVARGQTLAVLDSLGLPHPTQAKALRYWFDDDGTNVQMSTQLNGQQTLDVSVLQNGLHTLHYQVVDEDDAVAMVSSAVFLKMGVQKESASVRYLRYWFDEEASGVKTVTGTTQAFLLDVSDLTEGLHTIHYQAIDNTGEVAYVSSGVFLKISQHQNAMTLQSIRYWFDDNEANAHTFVQANGIHSIDAASLMEGLHTLHCQVVGTDAIPYYIASAIFMKGGGSIESGELTAGQLQYWFDDEQKNQSVELSNGIQMLDASMLTEGLHTVHYQVQCTDGTVTPPHSSIFLCMNVDTEMAAAKNLRYWFDDDKDVMETEVIAGPQLLDATHLQEGLHTLHFQVADSKGRLGAPTSAVFLKMDVQKASAATNIRYWFDDDANVKVTTVAGGTQTLDVSDLLTGLHALHYQLVDSKGDVTAPVTGLFMKNFDQVIEGDGHDHITMYEYWLNEDSKDRVKVTVNDTTDPYSLIALLPMPKSTIRSSLFHFEMTNGTPTIYAKNVFHVRFHDAQGYFADEAKEYLDYGAKKVVEPVGELQSKQSFAKVTENDIRWYTMQAAPGDTAAFRVSQPATVQVFAPSGKEVFTTSESASVKWGGLHTWEAGTYYVAVHDVTGSQNTMTLEYMHMDKYDVVDWDVHTVGNGGCSTITFKGNGFNDLYAVDLFDAAGKLIQALDITHDSDAETAVTFDFSGTVLGTCTLVFHFTEEDKRYTNILSVEETIDIELATNVSFPSSFLRGTSTTYTITVTNNGNSTAYDVPLEICLSTSSFEGIESVFFKDNNGNNIDALTFDFDEEDSITVEDERYFMDRIQCISGLSTFVILKDTLRNVEVGFSDRLITIPPKQKYIVYVEVKCSATINLYATTPSEWYSVYTTDSSPGQQIKRKTSQNKLCCEKEKWECIVSSVADVSGVVPKPLFDCIPSLIDLGTFTVFEIMCGNGKTTTENVKNYFANLFDNRNGNQSSAIGKWVFTGLGCWGLRILKKIDKLKEELKALKTSRTIAMNQSIEYNKLYVQYLNAYDDKMRLADEFFNKGIIKKAEELEEEAKGLKWEAENYKQWCKDKYDESEKIARQMSDVELRIDQENVDIANIIDFFKNGIELSQAIKNDIMCTKERLYAEQNCPPNPGGGGGSSTPYTPVDPNDIHGYLSDAGTKFMADTLTKVNYTIEFENDTTLANAAAHTIVIRDTLDARWFDLKDFVPMNVRVGRHVVNLKDSEINRQSGKTSFVKTIDMRPEINAIAQVEGSFNEQTGIAEWRFTSLDPMTMEPTDDLMQGILPVNYNGTSGIGEVMFEVGMRQGKIDGSEVNNRASIVFDYEAPILTPTWTNIVDAVPPTSTITDVTMENDTIARLHIAGEDNRSGIWYYDVYAQMGQGTMWVKVGEHVTDPEFDYRVYEDIDYGFCVLAVDSAGNVEKKELRRDWPHDPNVPTPVLNMQGDGDDNVEPTYDLSGKQVPIRQKGVYVQKGRKRLLQK